MTRHEKRLRLLRKWRRTYMGGGLGDVRPVKVRLYSPKRGELLLDVPSELLWVLIQRNIRDTAKLIEGPLV